MEKQRHPEFPLAEGLIHLNHAAVGPWPKRTGDAVRRFSQENVELGSRYYSEWVAKENFLRRQLQQLLNAPSPDDIALVKNTSEALSFVAYGLDWRNGDNIVSSDEEFPSNRIPWQSLHAQGVEFRQADLRSHGSPEEALFSLVDRKTRLITVSSVQFASGLRLDLDCIGRFCRDRNILFCIDAIQTLGALRFDVQSCCADFVMADGHKWMLAPEGLGVFYTTPAARDMLRLTQYGWHMMKDTHGYENRPWSVHPSARRFECGSPNMLGIHALSASLSLILEIGMEQVESLVLDNARFLRQRIADSRDLVLLSDENAILISGIVLFRHKTLPSDTIYRHLADGGVLCAMRAGGIRYSPHFYNTRVEMETAISLAHSYKI
ncbi:MAG: aminotransferase class V-fold PLP-dependent enzyme [Gammaproteobacteria bacterium]